jgi:hypothetical protein
VGDVEGCVEPLRLGLAVDVDVEDVVGLVGRERELRDEDGQIRAQVVVDPAGEGVEVREVGRAGVERRSSWAWDGGFAPFIVVMRVAVVAGLARS